MYKIIGATVSCYIFFFNPKLGRVKQDKKDYKFQLLIAHHPYSGTFLHAESCRKYTIEDANSGQFLLFMVYSV